MDKGGGRWATDSLGPVSWAQAGGNACRQGVGDWGQPVCLGGCLRTKGALQEMCPLLLIGCSPVKEDVAKTIRLPPSSRMGLKRQRKTSTPRWCAGSHPPPCELPRPSFRALVLKPPQNSFSVNCSDHHGYRASKSPESPGRALPLKPAIPFLPCGGLMRPRKVLSDGHRRAQAPGAKAQRPGQRGRADHGHGRRDAAPGRPGGGLTSRVRKTTRTPACPPGECVRSHCSQEQTS
ncbi:uncharacterized protein LOC116659908 isoform X2 [Camelus ferus]|uniref:Uncharacterized protein LOC116659908 isoform X2 n=1 Tax=Camelus ferus TaxID=419612 RepID=A0A8B8S1T7_CAMFR|nr:uncharacterized protein LOC116659908 isoform X2 [Camelus ferus]